MSDYIIGIDEVGRGALAGPVVVAACAMPRELRITNYELGKLRDSKQLSAKQREQWDAHLRNHPKIHFAIARVNPRGIERMNISRAANLASVRAYTRLSQILNLKSKSHRVFLDGGLYLANSKWQRAHGETISARTVVRGDQKYNAIKAASIIAKVHRDTYMTRLAKKYPQYGFEAHKGYGTKKHFAAIRRHGPSEAHRRSFLGRIT